MAAGTGKWRMAWMGVGRRVAVDATKDDGRSSSKGGKAWKATRTSISSRGKDSIPELEAWTRTEKPEAAALSP